MKRFFLLLIILGLVALAIYNNQQSKNESPDQTPKIGFTAPYFSLQSLDNQEYQVQGQRNKPLILNFWASWCGPCRQEAPELKKIYLEYQDKIDFYAINITANDSISEAKAFVQEFQLPFPILLDQTGEVSNKYKIGSIPTTYFINSNGVIKQILIGAADRGTFEQYVKELIQ